MNFDLDKKYLDIQQQARECAAAVEPMAAEADEMSVVHDGVLKAVRDSGLSRLMVPARWGGLDDRLDPLSICLVREILMATSCHADSLFAMQGIGSYAISIAGSDAQCEEWLPKIASGECLPALALTEPDTGSDLRSISSTINSVDDGILLNGEKSFISNALSASLFMTLARDGEGYSMVLVPADAEGVEITPTPPVIAPHVMGEISFKDVLLSSDAVIGEPGKGFNYVLATLGVFRVSVAGAAVGLAQAALEEAVRHTRSRIVYGKPLNRLGAVAQMLADSWTEIEMARLFTYRAADRAKEDSEANIHHSSMAKLAASEMAGRVTDRCVQVMGRFGLISNSKIERLYRQARPMRIYEGASEVLRQAIAKKLSEEIN